MAQSRDSEFLARAAELAEQGRFRVEPNPVVGCVIVRKNKIVGEGFHAYWGGPHAEAAALRQARDDARGATVYVTLEPCGHRGKTGPCADALIRAGVKEVVFAATDPNPSTSGVGPKRLKEAGVIVRRARASKIIRAQLEPYFTAQGRNRPWVIAKWAMTLDGKIATRTGDSRWISCEKSRKFAHRHYRARCDAIMCGAGTVRTDDPSLTNRSGRGPQPLRVIVAGRRRLPSKSKVLNREATTIVAVPEPHLAPKRVESIVAGHGGKVDLKKLLRALHTRGIRRVLVEGGGEVHGALFDKNLVDQIAVFIAPKIIGGVAATAAVAGRGIGKMPQGMTLKDQREQKIEDDRLIEAFVVSGR